ncbi:MAG: hypothetical protein ACREM1_14705 [Longimicrobiales bacterium]
MPHPNTDPFAPVTRVELQAELADIRETLARISERMEHFATNMKHFATKEYVLKALLGTIGVIAAMLSIAVGVLLRFG